MSNLSQFFPTSSGAGETNTSGFRVFMETGTVTIPAGVCYVAYTAMGAGNCTSNNSCAGGNGGGFSHFDGALSCDASFVVTATVGSGISSTGCPSCVSGFSTGVICATGANASSVGCGFGGLINTNGGCTCLNWSGGSGAGGLFGNGGDGGKGGTAGLIGGGGGFGSGGGGGGSWLGRGGCGGGGGSPGSATCGCIMGGNGGAGTRGSGGSAGILGNCACGHGPGGSSNGESGYHVAYTDDGKYSQAKTFFAAAGGGGASAYGYNSALIFPGGNGGAGGGAGSGWCSGCNAGSGGFGGGAARSDACKSLPGCGGGGGGTGSGGGGNGVVAVEWWMGS